MRLAIEVPFAELEPSLKKAYREIGAQVNHSGFPEGQGPAVIDQRVGRGAVLKEAVEEAIPQQILAAVREHEVQDAGPAGRGELSSPTAQPLKFIASGRASRSRLPELGAIKVEVDEAGDRRRPRSTRSSTAPGQRFATLKTVERADGRRVTTCSSTWRPLGGQEVEGGTADEPVPRGRHGQLLPGLDDAAGGPVGRWVGGPSCASWWAGSWRAVTRRSRHHPDGEGAELRSSTTNSPGWPASSTPLRSCGPT